MGLLFIALVYRKFVRPMIERSRLRKQGVMYLDRPFVGEISAITEMAEKRPFESIFAEISRMIGLQKNGGKMPAVTGICLPGRVLVSINSVDFLEDVYIKQNAFNTKLVEDARIFCIMGERNVVFMDTFHKDYNMTRKVLSAAFFKSKLQALTTVIKEEVVELIKEI